MIKPFLTIEKQIALLKERGLKIEDEQFAADYLREHNYYRLSGYSLTLRKNDEFYNNASFLKLVQIYECDREMRNIMLCAIELIETKIKSLYAYYFSQKYGPYEYDNPEFFKEDEIEKSKDEIEGEEEIAESGFQVIINKSQKLKEKWGRQEPFIKHYNDMDEKLPLWAYVSLFTLSDISKLYNLIKDNDLKTEMAKEYDYTRSDLLGNALRCISILRNMCAHGIRLYNKSFIYKARLSSSDKILLREENGHKIFNKLVSYILIIRKLLNYEEFKQIKFKIIEIHKKYPKVNFGYYGFEDFWEENL